MSLATFLTEGNIRPRTFARDDIEDLIGLAERDLKDAAIPELSTDRRFMSAYDAALNLATIPLNCSGYETHGAGHHFVTFKLLPEFMGSDVKELATYFDSCRTKRHTGTYDRSGGFSEAEATELIEETQEFKEKVEAWMEDNCP